MRKILAMGLLVLAACLPADCLHAQALEILPSGCGTGNYLSGVPYVTLDPTGRACGAVSGYDSGPNSFTGTPANASHAAGQAVGPAGSATNQSGLFIVPLVRTAGNSSIVTQFAATFTSASTLVYVVRVWSKLPVNTTCQDNAAFAGNFATDDAFLVTPPFSITPAAPAVLTGDASNYVSLQGLTWDFKNADGTPSQNAYVCLQTVATDTADENKAIRIMMSGPQN